MNFLVQVHRSIFEPRFYSEVLEFRGLHVIGFIVRLILIASTLCGIANTFYVIDREKGIPPYVESTFKGMVIKDGVLNPNRATPYVPAAYLVGPLFDRMLNLPHVFDSIPDNFLVVDTGKTAWTLQQGAVFVMRSTHIEVHANAKSSINLPYKVILGGKDMDFTVDNVHSYLKSHFLGITFNNIIWNGFVCSGLMLFSVFFLALAAFIFRVERGRRLGHYIRIACFASSPIAVGSVLVALAGVKLPWTWHVLIFFSTSVMFRAIIATSTAIANLKQDEE